MRRFILTTSRPESLRTVTAKWIADHFPGIADAPLFMRAEGDLREGWQVKRDHLKGLDAVLIDDDSTCRRSVAPGRWVDARGPWRTSDAEVIALDIDGTLCATPRVGKAGYTAWRERVIAGEWPVAKGALQKFAAMDLAQHLPSNGETMAIKSAPRAELQKPTFHRRPE